LYFVFGIFLSKNGSKTPLIYALEPRLLFDGDLGADVASSIVYRDGNGGDVAPAVAPENQRENISFEFHSTRSAIVFIDGALEDTQTLAAAAPDHAEVHILDGDSDGFAQINDILQNHDRVDEIHIFGHGMAGEARLGTASLSLETLTTHSGTLAVLKDTLTEDGDILLYGCDIAVGEDGQTFIEELAELTAADIAASDDITGAGGDWELEVNTGLIEAETIEADEYASELGLTDPGNSNTYHAGIRYVESTSTKVMDNSSAYISNGQINVEEGGNGTTRNNNYYYVLLEKQDVAITGSSPVSRIDPDVTQDFGGNNNSGTVSNNSGNKGTPGVASFSTSTFGYTLSELHNESTATVNSYLIFLNHNNQNNFKIGQVVFEEEILGVFLNTGNTHSYINTVNNLYSSSQASYGSNNDGRVLESNNGGNWGAFFHADASTNVLNNGNDEFIISNYSGTNDRLQFKFSNGSGGDYIRVITRANSAPTVTSANDVSGSVTELSDGHADENTSNVTDTGYFTIADSNNDSVSVSVTSSSTTHSGGSVLGTLTPTVNNDTNDGSGQIDWTYAVADSDLDAMDAGESFTETFTLTVDDGNGGTVPQEVTVTINGAADPVLAAKNDFASVNEGESVTADTLSGVLHTTDTSSQDTGTDLSVNGFRLGGVEGQGTYSHSNNGSLEGEYGTLTMQLDGAYSYVANSNISGLDAGEVVYDHFNYRAKDVHNNNDTAVLTFTIVGQDDSNNLPTAADNTVTIAEEGTHTFDASEFNFADVDSDSLDHVTIVAGPAAGTLTLNGSAVNDGDDIAAADIPNLVYTPVANGNGDPYTTFQFKVNDGTADSASAYTMTVDVTPANDLPTAADNTVTINEDATKTFAASDFNFADVDSDSLSSIKIISLPATGALTLSGSAVSQNQTIATSQIANLVYTPVANGNGDPYTSFQFKVNDGTADSASAYTMTIDVTPVNDAPVAADIVASVLEGSTIQSGASRADLIGPTANLFDPNYNGDGSYQIGYETVGPMDLAFSPDGNKLYVLAHRDMQGNIDKRVVTYDLQSPWDVSARTFNGAKVYDLPADPAFNK
jgi:VCBS repeat-containing protein